MNGKKLLLMVMVLFVSVSMVQAEVYSVYDVQYTTDASGDSPYVDQTVDCTGGIVISKWVGGSTKLTIYDPDNSDGWGGIISKSYNGEFAAVNVGDEISFTNVLVEERGGNTQLSFDATASTDTENPGYDSTFSVVSTGNALPSGIVVSNSSFSEAYESMRVVLEDVEVTAMDLGRYGDNYELVNAAGSYWAGDYMNADLVFEDYHPLARIGAEFDSVSGIIEHKISSKNNVDWDYYQMLTEDSASFVPEPASMALLAVGGILLRRRRKV